MNTALSVLFSGAFMVAAVSPACAQTPTYDSGGPLMPEQAAYDVTFYDLTLFVSPSDSTIRGSVIVHADIVQPVDYLVLDLDPLLQVYSTQELTEGKRRNEPPYERRGGKLWLSLDGMRQPGEQVVMDIAYGGRPRIAPMPPWQGGFTWAKTPSGDPWIATTCQGEGADIWWPVKDHVSDEPDSVALHITVPDPLVVASNGRLLNVDENPSGSRTYDWFVSTPINAYNIALNIAPYQVIEDSYDSVAGDTFPVQFWVLPEAYERGKIFFSEIVDHLRFHEEVLGPYPFRADKYGVVQTPHLGMEHQTIIAYGANFRNDAMIGVDFGFDALHHHELSHEWWGNLVTCADWRDAWIHEGFGTYMQVLYVERLQGVQGRKRYLDNALSGTNSRLPIAPRASKTAEEAWRAPIYSKGAWVLHTLRFLIGDDALFAALRTMAYPTPEMALATDGRQTRFATTEDFRVIAEAASGMKLDWFFEVYLRNAALPRLAARKKDGVLTLAWTVDNNLPFPMPVEVEIDGVRQRVDMPNGLASIKLAGDVDVYVDPDGWLLAVQ